MTFIETLLGWSEIQQWGCAFHVGDVKCSLAQADLYIP